MILTHEEQLRLKISILKKHLKVVQDAINNMKEGKPTNVEFFTDNDKIEKPATMTEMLNYELFIKKNIAVNINKLEELTGPKKKYKI